MSSIQSAVEKGENDLICFYKGRFHNNEQCLNQVLMGSRCFLEDEKKNRWKSLGGALETGGIGFWFLQVVRSRT